MYDRHPAWDRIGRRILEEQWVRTRDKEARFRKLSPEEHYRMPWCAIRPSSPAFRFVTSPPVAGVRVVFVADANGKVSHADMEMGPQRWRGKRIR